MPTESGLYRYLQLIYGIFRMMKKTLIYTLLAGSSLLANGVEARWVKVPVPIDYALIKNIMLNQLYTGENNTAHLWRDGKNCSYLDLSEPNVDGQQGQIRIINNVQARLGSVLGSQCVPLLEWSGRLETLQQPQLDANGSILKFPVTKAVAYDRGGQSLTIDQLQDLLKRFAEPKLAMLQIDLNESRSEIEKTLTRFVPQQNKEQLSQALSTLKFDEIKVGETGLAVNISLDLPDQLEVAPRTGPAEALTDAEMQLWQDNMHQWEAFLTDIVNFANKDARSEAVQTTLAEVLADGRAVFQNALQNDAGTEKDPVRLFFTRSWTRLSPLLRTVAKDMPGAEGLRYLTFIAATDVLYELENNIGASFGLDVSTDGLRRLARMLIAKR